MSRTISIFTILLGLTAILGSCSQQLDRRDVLYSSDEIAMTGKVTKAFVEATTASLEADGFRTVSIIDEGNVFWFDETFKKDGDVYKAEGKRIYYPMEGTISLFSVYPPTQELTVSADAVSIQYVQDSDTDLLAARVLNVSHSKNALPMTFCHTLAQVKMQARCKENYTDIDVHMKEITVTGASSATYAYSDGGWTLSGETAGYSLFSGDKVIDSHETPTEVGEAMSFIPGTLSLNIKWECCQKGTTTKVSEYEADVEVTPAQALCSTYTLIVYDEGRKIRIGGIDVTEWDTTDDPVEMKMEAAYTDLSKVNFLTGKVMSRSTANTYVVRNDGTYRIPLVYGNGILKGEVNAVAYTNPGKAPDGSTNTTDFVNHLGDKITTPYIEEMTHSGVKLEAKSAGVIWTEMPGVIGNFSFITVDGEPCRYVQFDVTDMPRNGGNAIVAVMDAEGICLWSWQIWCYGDKLSKVRIENNNPGNYFNLLDVNLGWSWDDDSHTKGKSTTYNWGRKDPMPSAKAYSSTDEIVTEGYEKKSDYMSISYHTKYPGKFGGISVGAGGYSNIWDATCTKTDVSISTRTSQSVKSVYDPCPAGFKVPMGAVFSGCHSERMLYDSERKGWDFKAVISPSDISTVWFTFNQKRVGGSLSFSEECHLWVVEAFNNTGGYFAYFKDGSIPDKDNIPGIVKSGASGNSYSVRPVEDDQLILEELN